MALATPAAPWIRNYRRFADGTLEFNLSQYDRTIFATKSLSQSEDKTARTLWAEYEGFNALSPNLPWQLRGQFAPGGRRKSVIVPPESAEDEVRWGSRKVKVLPCPGEL